MSQAVNSISKTTGEGNSFSRFNDLPLELRNQIWVQGLPDIGSSYLFSFRPGCWSPRDPLPSDPGYHRLRLSRYELFLDFNYELLGKVCITTPLALVNREAYAITFKWMQRKNLRNDSQSSVEVVLTRPFDPMRDAIPFGQRDK
ncbi:hypothetical protein K461DRAFT_279025 [Myriangium duriaei CBS 260.36]|uniref:2EXR domain-containing protein n=1 Tax=Myriangium duriaei CBS 260.36 TaxID=1168546 RepID=A0A9P4J057_9PEZI|nr:hypothetical protein K461DRAFT_279025 [Myriangium duriaei CBS 260.36]